MKIYKFFFDKIISVFLILLFLPIFIVVPFIILAIDGKPILFRQKRLGINGRVFNFYKFRTMLNGKSISAKHDESRVTKLGNFLRNTSIDELPAFYNVLKGDMSIVGPRPMPLKYLKRFDKKQINRLNVKPGITGLAQINGRNMITWEERFKLDIEYVEKRSVFMDVKIIFLTIYVVISRKGVNPDKSYIMVEFFGKKNSSNEL